MASTTKRPVYDLKGGDVVAGLGEVYDTKVAGAVWTTIRYIDQAGEIKTMSLRSETKVETMN